jgi:hypothetical protein
MCHQAKVDGTWCGTQGELKRVLGRETLPLHRGSTEDELDDKFCLCPIDVRKIADEEGLVFEDTYMDFILHRM